MASRLPLTPLPKTTKRSLQAELEEIRSFQRQRDAVLGALAAPGQAHNVLLRLWSGETFERIYEKLETHHPASPTTGQGSDALSRTPHIKEDPFSTLTQTPLCSPPILDYSNSTDLHGSETSYIQSAIENQNPISDGTKVEADGLMSYLEAFMLSHMALPHGVNEYDTTDYTPTMPFGPFMEYKTPLIHPNTHYSGQTYPMDDVGNVNWWEPGLSGPVLASYTVSSSTNHSAWPYPQFPAPDISSQAQASHLQPSPMHSPENNGSPLISRSSLWGQSHRSNGSSIASAGESLYSTLLPPKKRKLEVNEQDSSITAGTRNDNKKNHKTSTDYKAQSKSPVQEAPSHDRERYRQASARNWQKKKQQTTDLEAAMNIAEARNCELHGEYSEVLSQVMDAKNALMDHAKCNHPAISSWLRCQTTKYVLNKGAAVDREQKDQYELGDMAAPAYPVGRKRAAYR
ncbi:uncharacterized protein ColSpa_12007 [Colletotrichum spaethianum]|uniref:BZIP domain-containing protein n=1 Tax=Colletotrichum spaethianum TaxID=700344 RepID=A0AA37ULI9_9PEZI|nr:uncharacterized protein ColSpa_12007 [Colletotrichum spaethianum]GKT51826.1 hypothetical protein ColSpa_12007 [Colletotrichum spaethianum]